MTAPPLLPDALRVEDDEVFRGRIPTSMQLGAHVCGDLRIIAHLPNGEAVAVQLPAAWLFGPTGVASFIETECKPAVESHEGEP